MECNVGSFKVKTIFDTGAELKVISQELADKITKEYPSIKIYRSTSRVTWANENRESCACKIQLNVAIGPVITAPVFDIMPNIFPHLFIGLRSMKKYDIMINPGKDEIEIQGIQIPFISKNEVSKSLY